MDESSNELKDLLKKQLTKELIVRLSYYAEKKIRYLRWQGCRGGPLPAGKVAEDIVSDAILKIYEGKRTWNPEVKPDLYDCVTSIIDSEVNHLAESFENITVRTEAVFREKTENGVKGSEVIENAPSIHLSPAEETMIEEEIKLGQEFIIILS